MGVRLKSILEVSSRLAAGKSGVFYFHALVHHNVQAGAARLLGRLFVFQTKLHPYRAGPNFDCLLNNARYSIEVTENIHHVYMPRN